MNALILAASLAAAFASPAPAASVPAAPVMDEAAAVAAAEAAARSQYEFSVRQAPAASAQALLLAPYGAEQLPDGRDPTQERTAEILRAKRTYWTAVQAGIFEAIKASPDDVTSADAPVWIGPHARHVMALAGELKVANLILADIAADEQALSKGVDGPSLIARKRALASRIGKAPSGPQ